MAPPGKVTATQRARRREDETPRVESPIDLIVAAVVAVVAAFAVFALPDGSAVRILLVAPVLFFVPGYLLIQALPIKAADRATKGLHAVVAVGVSPGLVGLLALLTAIVPGGFRPGPIVAIVTIACLAFAAGAYYRRSLVAHRQVASRAERDGAPLRQPVQ